MVKREIFNYNSVHEAMIELNSFIENNFIANIINIVEYRTSSGDYKITLFYRD